jgi:hypothetical protein
MLTTLKMMIGLLTAATGALALFAPRATINFTGLEPNGGRGLSEIRAVLGGLFIALGLAPIIIYDNDAFATLGAGYLGIAVVRLVSIFVDKSAVQSNWISLAVEIVFGIVLVLR